MTTTVSKEKPIGYRRNGMPWLDSLFMATCIAGITGIILFNLNWPTTIFLLPYLIFPWTRKQGTYNYSQIIDYTKPGKRITALIFALILFISMTYYIFSDRQQFSPVVATAITAVVFVGALVTMNQLVTYIVTRPPEGKEQATADL